MSLFTSTDHYAKELAKESAKQTESIILEQLNDFISRGLIIIEKTQPVLTTEIDQNNNYQVRLNQSCRLVLKDKEYIEKLEKENQELKELISKIKEIEL